MSVPFLPAVAAEPLHLEDPIAGTRRLTLALEGDPCGRGTRLRVVLSVPGLHGPQEVASATTAHPLLVHHVSAAAGSLPRDIYELRTDAAAWRLHRGEVPRVAAWLGIDASPLLRGGQP